MEWHNLNSLQEKYITMEVKMKETGFGALEIGFSNSAMYTFTRRLNL